MIDQQIFLETIEGTPQGGTISPLLANIALHGLEEEIKSQMLPYLSGGSKKIKLQSLAIIRYLGSKPLSNLVKSQSKTTTTPSEI